MMSKNCGDNVEGNMTAERYVCLIDYFLLHYISSENMERIYRIVQDVAMDEVSKKGVKEKRYHALIALESRKEIEDIMEIVTLYDNKDCRETADRLYDILKAARASE